MISSLRPRAAWLALAGLILIPIGASAAPTTTAYNDGDVFLGFRLDGGTQDYLVNLGPVSHFLSGSYTFTLGDIGADLGTLFNDTANSINWYDRTDLFYSIIGASGLGTNGEPANTLYTSNPDADPFARRSSQGSTAQRVAGLGGAYADNLSTNNSPVGLIQSTTGANSYASYQPGGTAANSQGISFAAFNPSNELNPNQTAYIDRLTQTNKPAGQVVLGTLDISNAGVVTFTAVPEPASAGLLLLSLGLLGCRRMRRPITVS